MPVRVAVTSSDGVLVDRHFGRAERFAVYEFADEKFEFIESRDSRPPCNTGEHDDFLLEKSVDRISDCQVVIVQSIGPGALELLQLRGIQATAAEQSVAEALTKLQQSILFRRILARVAAK